MRGPIVTARKQLGTVARQSDLGFRCAVAVSSGWRAVAVTASTDLVVEGYPRSANTYVVMAIAAASSSPLSIAHHLHAPAHVRRAARLHTPTIVLGREPIAAAASLMVREAVPARRALTAYYRFYEGIYRTREKVLYCPFFLATTRLGYVVETLNDRFGTDFVPPENTDAPDPKIVGQIDQLQIELAGDQSLESSSGRPSRIRSALAAEAARTLLDPALSSERGRAHHAYRVFIEVAMEQWPHLAVEPER